jgi:hypothetical protein
VRMEADRFHPLASKLTTDLVERFGARAHVIPAYRSKPDFGDMDILLEMEKVLLPGDTGPEQRAALEEFAYNNCNARVFSPNDTVISFDYRDTTADTDGLQVDLILSPAAEFDAALAYFSYNDLGNLIGRTAHMMGCSYGHRGLLYPFRDGNYLFRTLMVTSSPDEAMRFQGFDPARHHQGFENLAEIFDYASSSRYFNRDIFLLENRNHTSRTRDRKRKTYREFLEFLELHPELPAFPYPEDKSAWLPQLFAAFPKFEADYHQAHADLDQSRVVKELFNGAKVSAWTGLSGNALGEVMSRVRDSFATTADFHDFVVRSNEEDLRAKVRACSLRPPRMP